MPSNQTPTTTRRRFCVWLAGAPFYLRSSIALSDADGSTSPSTDLADTFKNPPPATRPYVLWMWMGSNVSERGITRDLEAMKEAGIGGATIFSVASTLTPWAGVILKSPTPEIITFTEPWWAMLRHAAAEAYRLGLELILFNCAGYESSGGTWITPELSMQEVVWSEQRVTGGSRFAGILARPTVDPHPQTPFPQVYIPSLGRVGIPIVEARQTYFKDIAVFAVPSEGAVAKERIIDLSGHMTPNGGINWDAPEGSWTLYRFGHTTTGALIQPAQWDATGLECDKMSVEAVTFHIQHVLSELKKHLGDFAGTSLTTLYFDSYEAGEPTWTGKMREEFQTRRGYDLKPWLPVFAGRTVVSDAETARFKQDFKRTVHDLYRDCYWATSGPLAHAAGLKIGAEPYEGPWEISEVVRYLDTPAVEFWTTNGRYFPVNVDSVVAAAHQLGDGIIAAEAFTSVPDFARWAAHPSWLKPIGDAAFCAGVNRINLHHFVQQPWDDRYKPGNTMGQWGIHFGRNQTWWKPGKAWIAYLWRCQTLLQSGKFVPPSAETGLKIESARPGLELQSIHRKIGDTELYFVANLAWKDGTAVCTFPVEGKQPELWDPVWGSIRDLPEFEQANGSTRLTIDFAPAQSFFVVFRKRTSSQNEGHRNFPTLARLAVIDGSWNVHFDPSWGGPAAVVFDALEDWTARNEKGIRYYSGTALYKKTVQVNSVAKGRRIYLDLGKLHHLAEVIMNGKNLGVVWTAPWQIEITDAIRVGDNQLEIACTNVWANRLIGDEQEPADVIWEMGDPIMKGGSFLKEFPDWFLRSEKRPSQGRYTFTTWNYFTKESKLEPSGLLGPVTLLIST
jgi:hypothetical protein